MRKSTLLPGEDPAEYDALRAEHYDQFAPNIDERDLLDLMIKYKWQLRRLHNCYDQMWTYEVERQLKSEDSAAPSLVGAFIQANRYSPHLINISRMIHSTDRALHCTRTASYAPRKSAGAPDPSASPPPNWLRSPKKHHIHPCTRYPPPPPRLPTQISPRLPPEI